MTLHSSQKRHTALKKQICIAQIGYTPEGQLEKIQRIITDHKDSDLIVFPELILHGHPSSEIPQGLLFRRMKLNYGAISRSLYEFIRASDARVVFGELKKRGERYYNLATCVSRKGISSYVKSHIHWTEDFVAGKKLEPVNISSLRLGMTICFDAAFPEVGRVLALKGATVIVNISAVPQDFPVKYMWRRLRGAALSNQVFVIYANRPGPYFSGHSAVFGPDGDCLARANQDESVLTVEIDLAQLEHWRQVERIYSHRRPELYRLLGRDIREPVLTEKIS